MTSDGEHWQSRALCGQRLDVDWDPGETGRGLAVAADELPALALCSVCPVRAQCLHDAMLGPAVMDAGIRGGTTARLRRRLRRGFRVYEKAPRR